MICMTKQAERWRQQQGRDTKHNKCKNTLNEVELNVNPSLEMAANKTIST